MNYIFRTVIIASGLACAAQAATPEENWLTKVYQDLLNRPADPAAQGFLPQAGSQQGRQQVVIAITSSAEYRGDLVQSMYQQYLKRGAQQAELAPWLAAFSQGATDEQIRAAIIGSPEYFQTRDGGSVDQFITTLYGDVLNRSPSPQQSAFFRVIIPFQSRAAVAMLLFSSSEYRGLLVAGDYQKYLGRPVDPAGSAAGIQFLQNGTDEQYLAFLLSSQEYFNDAQVSNGVDVKARFSQGSAVAFNPASPGTANLLVQVSGLSDGEPVLGLTQNQFHVTGHFQLPRQVCSFSSNSVTSFGSVGNGWYQMTVALANTHDLCQWVTGDYLANIAIQGSKQGATVATLNIQ